MKHIKMGEYLLKEYLTLIFLMGICRGLFIFFNRGGAEEIPLKIMGKSFLYGWIFDNSITCYYIGGLLIFLLVYSLLRVIWLGAAGKFIINIYKKYTLFFLFIIIIS